MQSLTTYRLDQLSAEEHKTLCKRPSRPAQEMIRTIQPILDAVRKDGDKAVQHYTRQFDNLDIDPVRIDPRMAEPTLDPAEQEAIDTAILNVERFHREQLRGNLQVETTRGVRCMRQIRPLQSVGLYIPGGSAPLPSTAIMLGVPAWVAGCKTIVMATPPDPKGNVPDPILYIARKTGVDSILLAGGAQAIAAMAYGTESIPKVDKLFGPGNQYVTAAKMALQNSDAMVSIDLPAGPSEVLVIADSAADPELVAADLLSQAEHGPDSQVVLVALDGFDLKATERELEQQLGDLPRADITRKALDNSFTVLASSIDQAISFSNDYAPEHLILNVADAADLIDKIEHAGSVFIGALTPESFGDYASGTNHTLPTYGYAKMYSGVSLESFQKSITFQEASEEGVRNLGPTVERLAEMEGLHAHKQAVTKRLNKLNRG